MARKVKILITGLTVGNMVFQEGDIVDVDGYKDLRDLADGKTIAGRRYAEWVDTVDTDSKHDPEPALSPKPAGQRSDLVQQLPTDLEGAIKAMVKAGRTKTDIVKELGASEAFSHRGVREKFDELLATGEVYAGESPGQYRVEE